MVEAYVKLRRRASLGYMIRTSLDSCKKTVGVPISSSVPDSPPMKISTLYL